jgi:hypothetical protein
MDRRISAADPVDRIEHGALDYRRIAGHIKRAGLCDERRLEHDLVPVGDLIRARGCDTETREDDRDRKGQKDANMKFHLISPLWGQTLWSEQT